MLTQELLEILTQPLSSAIGTVNTSNIPYFTRVFGVHLDPQSGDLKVVIPKETAQRALSDLSSNDKIALTICSEIDNTTYQVKGQAVGVAESSAAENEEAEMAKHKLVVSAAASMGDYIANLFDQYIVSPGWTVTIRVAEIFNQTPGKNAGKKIA